MQHSEKKDTTANIPSTTSTVASLLFRASPIDPALRPPSPSNDQSNDLPYNPSSSSAEIQSAADTAQVVSSASSQYSSTLPELASSSLERSPEETAIGSSAFSSSLGPSLPGLSVLASVASAPTSNLRCVPILSAWLYLR
ncbi:hypothetical protein BJX61DRAFT_545554 [Aspergillus egyptiacus]|nr:hypothetical protein BJX61DRAFT_545554 [Aspergillus egyptiacus]